MTHVRIRSYCICGSCRRRALRAVSVCTMCNQAPATTSWCFPVCQPCADWLDGLQGDLAQMEADDPALAELGRSVEGQAEALLRKRGDTP